MDIFINFGQTSTGIAVEDDFTLEVLSWSALSATPSTWPTEPKSSLVRGRRVRQRLHRRRKLFEIVSGGSDIERHRKLSTQTIILGGGANGASVNNGGYQAVLLRLDDADVRT